MKFRTEKDMENYRTTCLTDCKCGESSEQEMNRMMFYDEKAAKNWKTGAVNKCKYEKKKDLIVDDDLTCAQ